jgi:rhamnopyranosyl-N-acetylglucosaminyl-diphospho-decaprenol beta-1,3/1,4-galactofuranosyltransferase
VSAPAHVVAVVVTHNRAELLLECLEALSSQSHPVAEVIVVDCASTDDTLARLDAAAPRIPLTIVRLNRNGGGAEGFHYGVRAALERDCGWLWLMDDDAVPRPDTLAALLADPHASEASVLAPVVEDPSGRTLPINRGHFRPRWFFAPLVAATEPGRIDYCSFVGPLIRADAARRIGLPKREMFIRFDDLEYLSRLREPLWLVDSARIVHKDPRPVAAGLRARWRDYARPTPFADQWKRLYGLRNLLYCGLRDGYFSRPRALSHIVVYAVRTLLLDERRLTALALLIAYARDGFNGRFRNVPPERWPHLTPRQVDREALDYRLDPTAPG